MNIIYVIAAFGLGALISMQPPINAQAAAILGSPLLGAACSISISLVVVLVGALFVIGALMVAPKVGVAAFFVFVVLGQLAGAAIIDHLAGFGIPANPITWQRAAGILLVFAGAALTQLRF